MGVEIEDIRNIAIYPNPITPNEILNIEITTNKLHEVTGEFYDMKGALIRTLVPNQAYPDVTNIQFDMSDLPAGTYIIRVKL